MSSLEVSGFSNFNPRPPRGERREGCADRIFCLQFQSTPSARRATEREAWLEKTMDISIHALREESDADEGRPPVMTTEISIHALREEGDRHFVKWSDVPKVFQSTPSARRATAICKCVFWR